MPQRSGLTLIELLVVLVILVILTTVAITATSQVIDQGRYDATQRTLQNIQDAILGPPNQRGPDGSPLVTGFVADMGRLPTPVFGGGIIVGDPLRELWDPLAVAANTGTAYGPQSMPTMNIYSATSIYLLSNVWPPGLPAPSPPPAVTPTTVQATASLSCGWHGPYLQLGTGSAGRLLDGWGNPFDSMSQTLSPSFSLNNSYATAPNGLLTAGQQINIVRSLGADNLPDVGVQSNPYNQDQYVPAQFTAPPPTPLVSFTSPGTGTITVQVQTWWTNSGTTPPTTTQTNPVPAGSNDVVSVVLFTSVNGLLTPQFLPNPSPSSANFANCFPLPPAGASPAPSPTPVGPGTFTVAIGARAIQAFQFDSVTGVVRKRSPLSYVTVPPSGSVTMTLILQ
jgi:prepilin-type N-terminal cleavage/methylation domain-containing protein